MNNPFATTPPADTSSVEAYQASLITELRAQKCDIDAQIHEFSLGENDADLGLRNAQLEPYFKYLENGLEKLTPTVDRFVQWRSKRAEYLRFLQWSHNAARPAKLPDPLDTILVAMVFMLLEGGMTSMMMISEGKMDVMAGIGYGLIFASVNVIVGIVGGFFCLRYVNYKLGAPNPEPQDKRTRLIARVGYSIVLSVLAILVFCAARVRSLGSHEHIFSFDEIGFMSTFNDGIAVIIIVIGAVSSILAIWKGYSGLSDPVPGLSSARRHAETLINEDGMIALDALADSMSEIVEDALESAEDDLKLAKKAISTRTKSLLHLTDTVERHNTSIEDARARLQVFAHQHSSMIHRVKRSAAPVSVSFDERMFNTLSISPDVLSSFETQTSQSEVNKLQSDMAKLLNALGDALAKIELARTEFLASAPDLDVVSDK
ncbi:hypothetical protein [Ponticaulis sp.]|uniref:hypothetical protein n=1 Tax=Ponticaulis sp. TaxID=2020902 RepID=UPI000C58DACB|nr:hypothetical protein [Ponticaulis sp.]MAJ10329.1 hypothetical protein [Ponticaulis sp.]|tara:strand:- start:5268 stop:6563 length:1296 start_codon:yes stop_codon:yes gene_type:complete